MTIREHDSPRVVGTGFTVLDRIYADGNFAVEELGGSCGNVLVSLAMLHRMVTPLLALGTDEVGSLLVGEFERAGADTRFISRRRDVCSPVVAQHLDTASGSHSFSFTCRDTQVDFPPYEPIATEQVEAAESALASCTLFYTDRLSQSVVDAMTLSHAAGALIYFEPSEVHGELFERALELTSIIKYSYERVGSEIDHLVADSQAIAIVTHGAEGLEIRNGTRSIWCNAVHAARVADTAGSGDMVSVGIIDWLLGSVGPKPSLAIEDLLLGVVAGQRLAAANCAFTGARGLFRAMGSAYARSVLQPSRLGWSD
jgi:fructokinase